MGSYHIAVNLDAQEYMEPGTFGDGNKLREIAGSAGGLLTALAHVLASGERWAGARVVLAADEHDDGVWDEVYSGGYKDISAEVRRELEECSLATFPRASKEAE